VTLLGSAINSSLNIKSVPEDVWFYYARALQLDGNFTQAADAYNKFIKIAGRKTSAEYEVQMYLVQCSNRQGALSTEQVEPAFAEATAGKAEPKQDGSELRPKTTDEMKSVVAGQTDKGTTEVQDSKSVIPEKYDDKLKEAVKKQHEADSISRIALWVRKETEAAPPMKKEEMQQKADDYENKAAAKQAEADSVFLLMEQNTNHAAVKDSVTSQPVPRHMLSVFELRSEPAYNNKNPIPVDVGSQAGLVYSIQIAAFRNPVQPSIFKGLYPLYGKKRAETGVTYYYAGLFRKLSDARQALPKARDAGFADAFVVAMMDDTQISMERAALLEKEWSAKPLFVPELQIRVKENASAADTLPVGTLMFRAEVMRSKKPVKPEIIEKIELLAGARGFDMIKNSDGETVFLIGNFITFESADEYVSLLIRNGYNMARVAAYVGIYEIPIEAAKELINRL
jgi:tetratricopeptide (TPR) repeat protein